MKAVAAITMLVFGVYLFAASLAFLDGIYLPVPAWLLYLAAGHAFCEAAFARGREMGWNL